MARTTHGTRGAAVGAAKPAVLIRSIDSFGRVSKRVAPSSSAKNLTPAAESAVPSSRRDAIARFLTEKKQDEDAKSDIKAEEPITPTSTKVAKTTKTPKKATSSPSPAATSTRQRKRRAAEAIDDDHTTISPSQQPTPSAKRARRTASTKTAKTSVAELLARVAQKKTAELLPAADSDSDSPFHTTGNLIARLNINNTDSFCSSPPRSTSSSPRPASTAPTTPCESENEADACSKRVSPTALPIELLDLIRLQAAFAKSLALHHAHHGSNAPIDLRIFCPSVAQAWGKRKVTLDDVKRCIGVSAACNDNVSSNSMANALFLSDYNRGKICIELKADVDTGLVSTMTDQLNAAFETNLRSLWAAAVTSSSNNGKADMVKEFIDGLPKAPVTKCASLLQTSALRAKGQRTLEELMHGIALKKQEKEAQEALLKAPVPEPEAMEVDSSSSASGTTTAAPAAPMNLLDRIRFRQMQRTQMMAAGQLAAPPTPEELERRAALQRAGDIAEVLSMLCTAASLRQNNRLSFGMTAIVAKVKDSLRLPIAREEAAACVRLLAKEVSPEWLQMVSMGGREIVIMTANNVPSKTEIQNRVQNMTQ